MDELLAAIMERVCQDDEDSKPSAFEPTPGFAENWYLP